VSPCTPDTEGGEKPQRSKPLSGNTKPPATYHTADVGFDSLPGERIGGVIKTGKRDRGAKKSSLCFRQQYQQGLVPKVVWLVLLPSQPYVISMWNTTVPEALNTSPFGVT
jgi:hypothetical protein